MATYAFDFINEAGAIGAVTLGEFPADAEAVRGARNALVKSFTAVALDVWCEGRRIVRLTRDHPGDDDVVERKVETPALRNILGASASDQRIP